MYVNLRGYDPGQPLSPEYALARFLRALGVAGADIPSEVEERAASYRSLLDGRRILIVGERLKRDPFEVRQHMETEVVAVRRDRRLLPTRHRQGLHPSPQVIPDGHSIELDEPPALDVADEFGESCLGVPSCVEA